ncbi:DUF5996 family protein [Aggregatilinea lenta]|uniref:DUF5996 family protein n=1 Tax=Aggregatilinea lenta TaxID=913108 RepID=UPI001EE7D486|nr:DUF5996 family protein [Aggregatilinea lenta]
MENSVTDSSTIPDPMHDVPAWPDLPLDEWQDTYETLHRWTQIVGKIRLALAPMVNHWWQVTLYLTARGLTTSPIPYQSRSFQIDFDFIDHMLRIETSGGGTRAFELAPRSVADFYRTIMAELLALGIEVEIWTVPVEIEDRTPFEQDNAHAAYDPVYAQRHWRALVQADRVLKVFRSRFTGKVSPIHFFWGGFDLAVTRFSGRPAPDHPGSPNVARYVMQESYSHEVSSCGFWPGAGTGQPMFYAYAYPEPAGFRDYPIQPDAAYYDPAFGNFLLPYDAVRTSASPDETLLAFLQSTYEAAAINAQWDRAALER